MIINNPNCKHKSRKLMEKGNVHNNFDGFNFWAKMHDVIQSKTITVKGCCKHTRQQKCYALCGFTREQHSTQTDERLSNLQMCKAENYTETAPHNLYVKEKQNKTKKQVLKSNIKT